MLLEALINNLPSMVGYWDKNLCNVYSNNAYKNFFNKSPDEIVGKHIRDVIGDDLFFKNKVYIERVLKGEHVLFERDIPTPGGQVRSTQAEYIPVFSQDQTVAGFYVLVTDVTNIKKVEKEKEELYQKLIQNSKMVVLGERAGGVAHEINNPLSIIDVNLSVLSEMCQARAFDYKKAERIVSTLENTTKRISKIVSGLLHFSRERSEDPFFSAKDSVHH